ncbi:MAG: glycosyltransferase, partial [Bdellovibrionales bacterium]|nr:glycosyltransferase [Bdellovibrionales bacterium]
AEFSRFTDDIQMLHSFLSRPYHAQFVRAMLETRRPDVVLISHSEFGYHLLPFMRSVHPDAIYLDYTHCVSPYWINFPAIGAAWQSQLDCNICSSENLKSWIAEQGAQLDKIEVVTTNIDTDLWAPDFELRKKIREEFQIPAGQAVILYSCRLAFEKQPQVFARVMRALRDDGHDFVALVCGDGEERGWLERYIADHQLEGRVRLCGKVPNARMKEILQASDIFFLPSMNEGISLALYEAMAVGKTAVVADVGGQRELVIDGTGFIIPRADEQLEAESYHKVLSYLLKNPAQLEQIGMQARKRVQTHFRLDQMVDRMLEIFQRRMERKSSLELQLIDTRRALQVARDALEYGRLGRQIVTRILSAREIGERLQKMAGEMQALEEQKSALLHDAQQLQSTHQRYANEVQALEQSKQRVLQDLVTSARTL